VVNANLLAAEGDSAKVAGGVFNIGCGGSINLLELAAELNKLTSQDLTPKHADGRAGDIKFSEADISAAREGLGYEPEVSFSAGLAKTLDFYRE
jgi:UDP-N-acetylglucosamine 4-epimerase